MKAPTTNHAEPPQGIDISYVYEVIGELTLSNRMLHRHLLALRGENKRLQEALSHGNQLTTGPGPQLVKKGVVER